MRAGARMFHGKRLLFEPSRFDRSFRAESDGHRERYVMTPRGDVIVVYGEREVVDFYLADTRLSSIARIRDPSGDLCQGPTPIPEL